MAATQTGRISYKGLMSKPVWGLYTQGELVATIRADSAYEARDLFRSAGLKGERVIRVSV